MQKKSYELNIKFSVSVQFLTYVLCFDLLEALLFLKREPGFFQFCVGVLFFSQIFSIATFWEAKPNNLYINTTWIRLNLTISHVLAKSNLSGLGFAKERKLVRGVRTNINTFMKVAELIEVNIINAINAPQARGNGKMEMCNGTHPYFRWWDRLAMFNLTLGCLINCVNHFPSALGFCLCLLIKFRLVLHCSLCVLVK